MVSLDIFLMFIVVSLLFTVYSQEYYSNQLFRGLYDLMLLEYLHLNDNTCNFVLRHVV